VPDATAQTGDAGQPAEAALQDAELMVLRPAAPGCLATRIMFMLAPAGGPRRAAADGIGHTARTAAAGGSESSYAEYAGTESGSTESGRTESSGTESSGTGSEIVLLAAGTEHAGPGSGPDRLIALALARAAEGPASISYGGDDFVDVFFPDQEHELLREVTALATASQPQGLADVRELLELTQEQMALRLGVDPARVREIESDEPAATDLPTLAAYVEALGGRLDLSVDLGTERIQLG
jgi:DNA-binding XRE family transcriptional regulator